MPLTLSASDLGRLDPAGLKAEREKLLGERREALSSQKRILDAATGRSLTNAQQTDFDRYTNEIDVIDGDLRALEDLIARGRPDRSGLVDLAGHDGPQTAEERTWNDFLRGRVDASEMRAQGVVTGSAGGYLVPEGFRKKLVERMKYTGAVRRVAEVIHTDNGANLPFPTNDDTANIGAILAENTQVTEQDVSMGTVSLGSYTYTSKLVRVSLQLLEDNAFDLAGWLARTLAVRIARAQNAHFTTGTGTAQPTGLVTGATSGLTAASATAVTMDELISLVHTVDPAYRSEPDATGSSPKAKWMMSDTALQAIRKLKDSDNNYLLQPSVQGGIPDQLLGYSIVINPDMAAPAAGVKAVLFGNFEAGYVVRDVGTVEVLRLVERYADYLQHGFLGYLRSDGAVQDAYAYRALTMAAA